MKGDREALSCCDERVKSAERSEMYWMPPFRAGQATTGGMVRQRNMRRKPLHLARQLPKVEWDWKKMQPERDGLNVPILWTISLFGQSLTLLHSDSELPGVEHVT